MTAAAAVLNLVLGAVYTSYGVMTAVEMRRGWRTLGYSHFGAAWIAMAFTCGPHHLFHGVHLALEGRQAGPLDIVAVVAGLPFGVAWFLLRVEAFTGRGRGDRFLGGNPPWLLALPPLAGVYIVVLIASAVGRNGALRFPTVVTPNVALFFIYVTIGYFLFRTQLRNRPGAGGWSASGLSLAVVFPTCALMHAVFILYAVSGRYAYDVHGFAIDWLGVPAGLYFLWVVRALYKQALRDWNRHPAPVRSVAGVA
jgi:hypothetical protein